MSYLILINGNMMPLQLKLRTRVRWYTTLLGKKASLKVLLRKLRQLPVDQRPTDVRTTVLNAGASEREAKKSSSKPAGDGKEEEEDEEEERGFEGANDVSDLAANAEPVFVISTSSSDGSCGTGTKDNNSASSANSSANAGVVAKGSSFNGARRWVLAWTFHPGAAPAPPSAKVLARQPKEHKTTLRNAGAIQGSGEAAAASTSAVEAAAAAALAERPELGALRVLCVLPAAPLKLMDEVSVGEAQCEAGQENTSSVTASAVAPINTLAAPSPSSVGKRTCQSLSSSMATHETAEARGNKRARFEPTPLREAAFADAGEAAPYDDRRDMVRGMS
jgi:hypothetical protein